MTVTRILFLCFVLFSGLSASETPKLTIKVENIEELSGNIRIGLFNTKDNFLKEKSIFKRYKIPVKNTVETIVIDDLPQGEYAFMLYHDKNSDGKMNRNLIGIPQEPFSFSNNVRPKFSLPTFEDCKFALKQNTTMKIQLKYYNQK